MSVTVNKTPSSYRDLEEIAGFIEQRNPKAAHQFLTTAEKMFNLLASQPLLGEIYPYPRQPELRYCTLGRRFRSYVVFYRPIADGVEIIRVLHGAQNLPSLLDK